MADTWWRVARALSAVEPTDRDGWARRFVDIMTDFKFIPGGRILAGAGRAGNATLLNCFMMGAIEDTPEGIARALEEGAVTMRHGGGVGYDFSSLAPGGAGEGSRMGGLLERWNAMCHEVSRSSARRGAMMGVLRCDHPEIETFIAAKRGAGALSNFNLSVLVTDALVAAMRAGRAWPLTGAGGCAVVRSVDAAALWQLIARAAYESAEPGVLFIDRINRLNTLAYCERIVGTNPCGEIPLPHYGACDLGSINLVAFVKAPFASEARFDEAAIARTTATAVRLLDNVIDVSRYPLSQHAEAARRTRRIGLGITGLADALTMLNLSYASARGRDATAAAMAAICHAAYRASVRLAAEKGAFPAFERERFLAGTFARALPADIRDGIARDGLRNSHLIAIAPAGTISLLANNVSSGIEPAFAAEFERNIHYENGAQRRVTMIDHAVAAWRRRVGDPASVPPTFAAVTDIGVSDQLTMLAALQPFVDNAISKTVVVPATLAFEAFQPTFDIAYDLGLKGCSAYRATPARPGVFCPREPSPATPVIASEPAGTPPGT